MLEYINYSDIGVSRKLGKLELGGMQKVLRVCRGYSDEKVENPCSRPV